MHWELSCFWSACCHDVRSGVPCETGAGRHLPGTRANQGLAFLGCPASGNKKPAGVAGFGKWWWGGTLRQTYVTQRLRAAANSCGKVRNPAPTAEGPISSARPRSPDKCIVQDASSIPVCVIEPVSETSQANRTGRAIFGLRAWLAVWRLAGLERIRSIAWL